MADTFYRVLDQLSEPKETQLADEVPEHSLEYLQSVYRDPGQPQATRIRCAALALPFERPKLAVVASLDGQGFAEQMKALARERYAGGMVIDAQPLAQPADGSVTNAEGSRDVG